jgi:YfiH family protein
VLHNRQLLRERLGLTQEPFWLSQVHGNRVVAASAMSTGVAADASYSRETGLACVVMTADCLPVVLCDRQGTVVAAAHAGWRGLAAGVLEATLAAMEVQPEELLAWLGPAIGSNAFEVGDEVREVFVDDHPGSAVCFAANSNGRWLANLVELARQRLQALGVRWIYGGHWCTFADSRRFFSHRRDRGRTGRMASLIWLDPATHEPG